MKNNHWEKTAFFILVISFLLGSIGIYPISAKEDKEIKFVAQNIKLYEDTTKILAEEVKKLGYTLNYKFLSDNTQLNEAVENGEAFANYHQHVAYLTEFNKVHHTHLAIAFKVFTDRAAIFSKKHPDIHKLPDNANISIPVDPGNNFRTFIILADAGLIKLRPGVAPASVTQKDIIENPHRFRFTEVDYTMLSRAFEDADAGFLYATVAAEIGLDYNKDGLLKERKELQSPDVIAVREENVNSPKTKILQKAYQTDRLKKVLRDEYNGIEVLLPAW